MKGNRNYMHMKFFWKCMGLSQNSKRQKESCHNIDNKFFVKIWAQILRATEAMAFHVSTVKNSPSETNQPGVGPCRRRQNKWNQHVERMSQRQLRLATCWPEMWHVWQVLHQNAPDLSLESEIGQTMCKISAEQMSRFKLMQKLKYQKSPPGKLLHQFSVSAQGILNHQPCSQHPLLSCSHYQYTCEHSMVCKGVSHTLPCSSWLIVFALTFH